MLDEQEQMCEGGSLIVSPMGELIVEPLFGSTGALIAELDLNEVQKSKLDFDVIGHYARNDIFTYEASDQPEMLSEKDLEL